MYSKFSIIKLKASFIDNAKAQKVFHLSNKMIF